MKLRADARAFTELFEQGEQVWLYNPKRKKGLIPKLISPWDGPYTIIKRLSDVTYRIQRTGGSPMRVVHYNRLWKHQGAPHFSWERDVSTASTGESDMSAREVRPENSPETTERGVGGGKGFPDQAASEVPNTRQYNLRKDRRPPARFGA